MRGHTFAFQEHAQQEMLRCDLRVAQSLRFFGREIEHGARPTCELVETVTPR
jgi:hypothetical protein